jgi:hypothetical protein
MHENCCGTKYAAINYFMGLAMIFMHALIAYYEIY